MLFSVSVRSRAALFSRAARVAMVAAILSIPAAAHAQSAASEAETHYQFIDELLNADVAKPFGDPLFGSHQPRPRTLLIRPRTNFIPELYESVEQI